MKWSATLKIGGAAQETFSNEDLKKVAAWIESKIPEYGSKRTDYEIVIRRVEPPHFTGSCKD